MDCKSESYYISVLLQKTQTSCILFSFTDPSLWMELNGAFYIGCLEEISKEENIWRAIIYWLMKEMLHLTLRFESGFEEFLGRVAECFKYSKLSFIKCSFYKWWRLKLTWIYLIHVKSYCILYAYFVLNKIFYKSDASFPVSYSSSISRALSMLINRNNLDYYFCYYYYYFVVDNYGFSLEVYKSWIISHHGSCVPKMACWCQISQQGLPLKVPNKFVFFCNITNICQVATAFWSSATVLLYSIYNMYVQAFIHTLNKTFGALINR